MKSESILRPWKFSFSGRPVEIHRAAEIKFAGPIVQLIDGDGGTLQAFSNRGLERAEPITEADVRAIEAAQDLAAQREPLAKRLARVPKKPKAGEFIGGWPAGEGTFEVLKDHVLSPGVFVFTGERITAPLWLAEPLTQSAYGRPALKRVDTPAAKPEAA